MKLTQLDPQQILKHTFDEEKQANRVTLIDGLHINTDKIEAAIKDAFKNIKIPEQIPPPLATMATEMPLPPPIVIKEYEKIEIPVIVHEPKIVTIEKPVVVTEIKIIEIEKQIIVKEQEIKEIKIPYIVTKQEPISQWVKYAVAFYMGMSLLINLVALFKK